MIENIQISSGIDSEKVLLIKCGDRVVLQKKSATSHEYIGRGIDVKADDLIIALISMFNSKETTQSKSG